MGGALSYDLVHGTDTLEILKELLNGIRMAVNLAEVNVAAGIAYDSVNALLAVGHSIAAT